MTPDEAFNHLSLVEHSLRYLAQAEGGDTGALLELLAEELNTILQTLDVKK